MPQKHLSPKFLNQNAGFLVGKQRDSRIVNFQTCPYEAQRGPRNRTNAASFCCREIDKTIISSIPSRNHIAHVPFHSQAFSHEVFLFSITLQQSDSSFSSFFQAFSFPRISNHVITQPFHHSSLFFSHLATKKAAAFYFQWPPISCHRCDPS